MGYVGDSYTALKTSVNSSQARTRRGPVQVHVATWNSKGGEPWCGYLPHPTGPYSQRSA